MDIIQNMHLFCYGFNVVAVSNGFKEDEPFAQWGVLVYIYVIYLISVYVFIDEDNS
jgi:hypothetical protein